ncbi:tagatose-bisphosphate aldolase [Vagococcus sp. JNUCC 83]
MKKISEKKLARMNQLSTESGVIAALAIDQRGALKRMLSEQGFTGDTESAIVEFKELISEYLTPYSSSILLDPEYGLPASKVKVEDAGLLLAYEKTGYDATEPGRFPDLLPEWSALRLKEAGADAVKFLLYYDVDESDEINERKQAFVERIGSECVAEDMPFYLELLTYDATIDDAKGKEYAKLKPHKVNEMMKEFSKDLYQVDVLKVEVPINMNYVEGFAKESADVVYTKEEALSYFKEQSDSTQLPFIFLSAGVSAKLFQDTLHFAKEAGSTFNGVLCGRATWKDSVEVFVKDGKEAAVEWLKTQGKQNMDELNDALYATASSWHTKLS